MLKNPASLRAGEVELREIVEEDPSCSDAWLALGGFYKDRGLDVRAASMFQKVLEIRPGNPRATAELRAFSGAEGASRAPRSA
jgi:Tfp pilus assembly protein PilF